ncbi:MAG: cupredoxin domain-containing protein [Actinomycetota bacterium]
MARPIRHLLVTAVAAVCMVGLSAPAIGDTKTIKAFGDPGSFHWHPKSREISKGDKIVWKNTTNTQHKVVAYGDNWSKDSTIAANGGKTSKRFKKTGTFKFRCTIGEGTPSAHSELSGGQCEGMCGKVRVTS